MVKEHRRRARSSSEESDDSVQRRRKRKHVRQRSESPRDHHKSTSHRSRHRSESPVHIKRHIKQEPESDDSDHNDRHKHKVKKEKFHRHSDHKDHREDRRHTHGDHQRRPEQHRQMRIKQEPSDQDNWRSQQTDRRRHEQHRRADRDRRDRLPDNQNYGEQEADDSSEPPQPKDAPNFELSGKLTEDTNTYKGVVIKYNEPPEARKPKKRWRLYPFKNDEALKPFHMHRQSAYLFGRERLIADIPIDHPSCSKQHAVFQYRMVPFEKEDGRKAHRIAPYVIDLGSANGTFVNNKPIEAQRYVELMEKDVLKFGFSSREYVLLHDRSDTAELDDE